MLNQSFIKKSLVALLFPFSVANAEIVIHGTRAIYPSDAREITLQVSNNGAKPSLVQAWIDEGDPKSTPDQSKAPFMITPPISRVDPAKSQALRITALPKANQLSKDKETVFWLNVLDIPPKPKGNSADDVPDNFLQLAIRSRIKFFYRPAGLKEDIAQAPTKLQWSRAGNKLAVNNPTPYHITVTSILTDNAGKKTDLLSEGIMINPMSSTTLDIKQSVPLNKLTFTTINDFGGRVSTDLKLQ